MILSTIFQSWNWLGVKYVYIYNPEMDGFQVVFVRSFFAIIVLLLLLNIDLKRIMYDEFPSESKMHMVYRMTTGCFGILTMNFVVKYFTLSNIAVIINLNPIFTLFFAYFLLREQVTRTDIICVFLTFAAVILVILGMR